MDVAVQLLALLGRLLSALLLRLLGNSTIQQTRTKLEAKCQVKSTGSGCDKEVEREQIVESYRVFTFATAVPKEEGMAPENEFPLKSLQVEEGIRQ